MKQRLGPFKEMLKFLDDLRVQELQQAEPDGVWLDLEDDAEADAVVPEEE